jgi:tetratricopeptide (TPR) repeat protein
MFFDCRNAVDAAALLERLADADRLPIVAVAAGGPRHRGQFDVRVLAEELDGSANVYLLPRDGLPQLDRSLNVFGGAARIWYPGLNVDAGRAVATEHPYFVATAPADVASKTQAIVEHIVSRASGAPYILTVDWRGRLVNEPTNIAAIVELVKDHQRNDAVVGVGPETLPRAEHERLAHAVGKRAQIVVVASAEDAEWLSAVLPSTGLAPGVIRVWWPGVGMRTSDTVHPAFRLRATDQPFSELASAVANYVNRGLMEPEYIRPDGSREPTTIEDLAAHLLDAGRERAVVGVAPGIGGDVIEPHELAAAIGDIAVVVHVPTRAASARLAARLPRGLAAWAGGIRLWLPGLTWSSKTRFHPVFKPADPSHVPKHVAARLVELAAEAVRRRAFAPFPGPPSSPASRVRMRIQEAAQLELDVPGHERGASAYELALRSSLAAAKRREYAGAIAGFRDADEIIRSTITRDRPHKVVYSLGRFAEGMFDLGQQCGGQHRLACFEESVIAFERALAAGEALTPEQAAAAAAAALDLDVLRSKLARQCHWTARVRAERGDAAGAEALARRALTLLDQLTTKATPGTARAWLLFMKAMIVKDGRRLGTAPRLEAEEAGLALLLQAVAELTGGSGLVCLAPDHVIAPEVPGGQTLEIALNVLTALAETYIETGERTAALAVFDLLDMYREPLRGNAHHEEVLLRAALMRGQLELDHGDFWAGVTRLEAELARVKLPRLGARARGQAIGAIQALASVLRKQRALRESAFYSDWAERLRRPARFSAVASASHRRPTKRRRTTEEKEPAAPAQMPRADAVAGAQARAAVLTGRLLDAVRNQDVHHVVTNLIATARDLTKWDKRAQADPVVVELIDIAPIREAVAEIDAWHPRRRVPRDPGLPLEWFEFGDCGARRFRQLALACYLIAYEFAHNYSPGVAPTLLREICGRIMTDHGPRDEVRSLALAAAMQAKALGRWNDAVRAFLIATRASLPDDPAAAVSYATEALRELLQGLAFVGLGDDRMGALRRHEESAADIVKLLLRAGAPGGDIFAAADASKGQALMATRTAVTGPARSHDAIREFVDLQLAELSEHLRVAAERPDDEAERLAAIQRRVSSARRRAIREAPKLLRVWAETRPAKIEEALTAQLRRTAVVQYVELDRQLFACAVRSSCDGVAYWVSAEPLADTRDVLDVTTAVWDDVLSPARSTSHDASFEDAFDLVFGGAARDTSEPLARFCDGAETLVIVPAGGPTLGAATARLPFHALMRDGRCVVDDHNVVYAPSVAFSRHGERASTARHALAIGTDPDIEAPVECASVARIFCGLPGFTCDTLDDIGKIAHVLLPWRGRAEHNYAVLHIAAHGQTCPFPKHMDSSIDFSGLSITASDWLLRAPRAQLVFINCCSLGRQGGRAGDLFGLPFAILGSGSQSAILATSPVRPDDARAFATHFYTRLARGTGKAEAFAATMRALREAGAPRQAWAPYFFAGDPAPLDLS